MMMLRKHPPKKKDVFFYFFFANPETSLYFSNEKFLSGPRKHHGLKIS